MIPRPGTVARHRLPLLPARRGADALPRRADDAENLGAVVRLLFEGPTENEAATATTELPRVTDAPQLAIGDYGALYVRLPGQTVPLSRLAMLQLTCTMHHAAPPLPTAASRADTEADGDTARDAALPSDLEVLGDGWTMTRPDEACPAAPQS
ncbi:hypothetical protein SHKM778_90380 [Streptomyces sp. KM77-8]|uniref:Uncharacterized protein n=1 Tax=Streptomyces haneummycinicus TaxID=3074435 RepID=A0AAT9HZ60_9ACTN